MSNISNIIDLLNEYVIVIPKIQRDYAQGRKLNAESEIRNNLLDNIFSVLTDNNNSIRLNYIYGVPEPTQDIPNKMILIDGQQRVTTLYLLWLYLLVNYDSTAKYQPLTKRLIYESRSTSEDFCSFLITNQDVLKKTSGLISDTIQNNKRFLKKWWNDPTISGMITTLNDINAKAYELEKANYIVEIENLKNVNFSFISLDGFKRQEELYATMNGRGKALTEFEILKPTLIKGCEKIARLNVSNDINEIWSPIFWKYAEKRHAKNSSLVDKKYDLYQYNYYCFIISMLYAQENTFEKGQSFSEIKKYNQWLFDETLNHKKEIEFTVYTMNHFDEYFIDNDDFLSEISTDYQDGKIFFDDLIPTHIVDNCCDGILELQERCILWAYIRFKYDEYQNNLNGQTVQKYYSLIRDLYTEAWDSNTPLSIAKKPQAFNVANKTIQKFHNILSGKDTNTLQAKQILLNFL